jgi:predicted ribosome quality control (RQC) complex YloA/Tae2 family protein
MVVVGDTGLRVLSLSLLLLLSSTLQLHTAPARRPSTTPSTSTIQAVDFSTAFLCTRELKSQVVPSRVENFIQVSSHALALQVRTLDGQKWVELVWDNLASRCNLGVAPPPGKELMSYTFSAQLRSLVKGLNVIDVALAKPFERIIVISLGPRLNEAATHRIYVEIMSSRSNVILTQVDASEETVLCCAYQVNAVR